MKPRVGTAAALVSYLLLTILFTDPLVRAPATTIEWGGGDPLLVAYILSWGGHALFHDPTRIFDAPFLHPTPNTLSLSDHLLSVSWPFAPLALLGRPLLFYNATVFASFFLSAALFFAYLRRVGCAVFPAWLGGVLFGFLPWRYGQLGHAQLLYTWWIALALLAIEAWFARPRVLSAIAAGVSFALVFEASVYHAFFFGFFLLGYLPLRAAFRPRESPRVRPWEALLHGAAAVAIAVGLLVPSLLAYRRMSSVLTAVDTSESTVRRGADLLDYVNPPSLSYLWGRFTHFDHPYSDVPWEMHAFPGALALAAVLLVPAVLLLRKRKLEGPGTAVPALAAGAFVCFLLSVGPVLHAAGRAIAVPLPYRFLHAHMPGFSGLRVPTRASFYPGLAGAALAAIAVDALIRAPRLPRRGPVAASVRVALAAAVLLDVAPHALPYRAVPEYDRLRVAMGSASPPPSGSGVDLVLPISTSAGYAAPVASAPAFRRIVNGVSGYLPPPNRQTFEAFSEETFGSRQSDRMRDLNVERLFLDRTRMAASTESDILGELSRSRGHPRSAGTWAGYEVVFLSWPAADAAGR